MKMDTDCYEGKTAVISNLSVLGVAFSKVQSGSEGSFFFFFLLFFSYVRSLEIIYNVDVGEEVLMAGINFDRLFRCLSLYNNNNQFGGRS